MNITMDDLISNLIDDNFVDTDKDYAVIDIDGEIVQVFETYEDAEEWIGADTEDYQIVRNEFSY